MFTCTWVILFTYSALANDRQSVSVRVRRLAPPPGARSDGRGSVGVAQHGVEGVGEVVLVGAAVVLLSDGHQTRQAHDEQQQELQRQSRPQDPQQEGLAASRSSATARLGGTTARGSARRSPAGPGHESSALTLITTTSQRQKSG